MKILIVTTGYPRNSSDFSGIFIRRLAVAMTELGAKVTVLAPGDRDARSREWDEGIEVVRFWYAPRPLMRVAYGAGGIPENLRRWPWLILIIPFFVISLVVKSIVVAKDCDVIHANWVATGLFALLAKMVRRKPLFVTLRGMDFKEGRSLLLPFVARRADALTTVNERWFEDLRRVFGNKVFYTPNGVEVPRESVDVRNRFGFTSDQIVVLFVGVMSLRKGADILAEVARAMLDIDNSVRFLVIGPGDPEKFNLNRIPNIVCAGELPPDEALSSYAPCDLFLLPSRHEGRPNALLEAMASGLPSIATRLPGVIEVLSDRCGIIVDVENPSAIVEGIRALARDPCRRKMMGKNAQLRIEELSLDWESSAKQYLRVFQGVGQCVG